MSIPEPGKSVELEVKQFQQLLLNWFDSHGRKHLPWQQDKSPYRVWISEIMLQQTQVATVIPYFERFIKRFPDIAALAKAHDDEVLHLWSGLGYYSRARNLHRAAKQILSAFNGYFPETLAELETLPGIGPSTAGAILAIAFNQRAAILDGNVKRVLTRLHGISDPINEKNTEKRLWQLAQSYTPTNRSADYTQALMDLGATLCTRSKPQCVTCPFTHHCKANNENTQHLLPKKKTPKPLPIRKVTFLIFKKGELILLQKRPPVGVWAGLWSFPEIAGTPAPDTIHQFGVHHTHLAFTSYQKMPSFRHTFSHFHLDIFPIVIVFQKRMKKIMDDGNSVWYNLAIPPSLGLPKPVQRILQNIV